MRVKITPAVGGWKVTPAKKNGHPHFMGTVYLKDAFKVDDNLYGELVHETNSVLEPTHPALINKLKRTSYKAIQKATIVYAYGDTIMKWEK